ncbi:MAG: hypothetical protein CVV27_12465 [Candidatus Melainabacteria bacterium HGW-Melainabacteria-1]|nr:MAG: hypothetical protein CVV27_12465 [Candidatus Melainabacteria bacterium HGW-Melainabacteria-1]
MSTGQLSTQESALFELVSQILEELESGLPAFASAAAEAVYKAHPEVSTHFDLRQVKALQRDVRQVAEDQTARIIGTLADEELWLLDTARKVRETLHQNLKVWKVIQQLSPTLDAVLEKYGYPPRMGRSGAGFAQTELTSSEQLPNADRIRLLAIKYWTSLMRMQQQRIDQLKQTQAAHHKKLDEMWNH